MSGSDPIALQCRCSFGLQGLEMASKSVALLGLRTRPEVVTKQSHNAMNNFHSATKTALVLFNKCNQRIQGRSANNCYWSGLVRRKRQPSRNNDRRMALTQTC